MAPLPAQAEVDFELAQVLADVGTLPAMVTPVRDPEGELVVTPAEYFVPDVPGDSFGVTRPLVVPSPAGLAGGDAGGSQPSTGSVSCSAVPPTVPAVSTPEESFVFQAADGNQYQPCSMGSRWVAICLRLP